MKSEDSKFVCSVAIYIYDDVKAEMVEFLIGGIKTFNNLEDAKQYSNDIQVLLKGGKRKMKSKVELAFDKIEEKTYTQDEGKWLYCELWYCKEEDAIMLEMSDRYGEHYDTLEVTTDYVEEEE